MTARSEDSLDKEHLDTIGSSLHCLALCVVSIKRNIKRILETFPTLAPANSIRVHFTNSQKSMSHSDMHVSDLSERRKTQTAVL